jgi:HSP20 family molecular chaperone IbpA
MLSLLDILQLQLGSTPDHSLIKCDVLENLDEFQIKANSAGVKASDIKIDIDPDQRVIHLTFSRPSWPATTTESDVKFLHSELGGSKTLHRSIRIPKQSLLRLDAIKSWSKDGIVTISIPRVSPFETHEVRKSVQV